MGKDKLIEKKISYDGVFDFKDFYSFFYSMLSDWEYGVGEKSYSEKTKGETKDIDITWEANRKIDDYFKFELVISIRILGLKNVDVLKDGKKAKSNSGKLDVKIIGLLDSDYQAKWSGKPLLDFLRKIYDTFINKKVVKAMEDKLKGEVEDSSDQLKAFLVLETRK